MTLPRALAAIAVAAAVLGTGALFFTSRDEPQGMFDRARRHVERDAYLKQACSIPHVWAKRIERGWEKGPLQQNDLAFVPRPPVYAGGPVNTSHSGPYDYLQRVPFIFYGPGFVPPRGSVAMPGEVTVADLPPTLASLMGFDFPDRAGKPLKSIFSQAARPPGLIVTVVIDGGGWNVLDYWPRTWPHIARLIDEGVSVDNVTVGSTPSITPAIHTTLSTGAWPRDHGVTSIVERNDRGTIVGAFSREPRTADNVIEPKLNLRRTTLADLWDQAVDNSAGVAMVGFGNYVAGMIGHGSSLEGADKDIAALEREGEWATERRYFRLPRYLKTDVAGPEGDLERLDQADGRLDGKWRGHAMTPLDATPAFSAWQLRTLEALIEREGFGDDDVTDLLYVNFKPPDAAGHVWNMTAVEQKDAIASVDRAVGGLVRFLDGTLGRDRYVLALTADHGQTPYRPHDWPLNGNELKKDVRAAFDRRDNQRGLIQSSTATTYFLDSAELRANGVTPEEIASFLSSYTLADNAGAKVPKSHEAQADMRVFDAVIPGRRIDDVVRCTADGR